MTIYIPKLHEPPLRQLSLLGTGARFSVKKADGSVTAFVYEWDDMKVVVNVMPHSDLGKHLDGFVGYAQSVAAAQGRSADEVLLDRIRSTTLVLGFVVEGAEDREVWHDRVEDLIATICYNTGALLFWEGTVFDENCQQLLPYV